MDRLLGCNIKPGKMLPVHVSAMCMKRDTFQKMCLTVSSGLMLNYEMRQRLSKGQSGMDNPETLTTLGKQIKTQRNTEN